MKFDKILIQLNGLMLLLPTLLLQLNSIELGPLKIAHIETGLSLIILVLNGGMYFLGDRSRISVDRQLLVSGLLLIGYTSLNSLYHYNQNQSAQFLEYATPVGQLTFAILWLLVISSYPWHKFELWEVYLTFAILVTSINLAFWLVSGREIPFVGFSSHKNNIGLSGLTIAFFSVWRCYDLNTKLAKWLTVTATALSIFLIVISLSRSCFISIAVTLVVAGAYWTIDRLGFRLRFFGNLAVYSAVFAFCLIFPFLFIHYNESEGEIDAFGRPVNNGRETLWPAIIEEIETAPISGFGFQFEYELRSYEDKVYHCHNLYLAVLHFCGIFGMAGVYFFFWRIWRLMTVLYDEKLCFIFVGFFCGGLIQNCFEVYGFFHHHSFLTFWCSIGAIISYVRVNLVRELPVTRAVN